MLASKQRALAHVRSRARALGVLALSGALGHGCAGRPASSDPVGFSAWLGQRAGVIVAPEDFVWGPRGSLFGELAWGRELWFLGAPAGGGPRDLYRTVVRLAPNGRPLSLGRARNVSETTEADESGLMLHEGRVVFASAARGHVNAVSVLELAASARTDLVLDVKAGAVALSLVGQELRLELAELAQSAAFDLERHVFTGNGATGFAHARPAPRDEGSLGLTLAAQSRAWLGPTLTAWGGQLVFALKDAGKRVFPRTGTTPAPNAAPSFVPLSHAWLKPPLGADRVADTPERYLSRAELHPDPKRPASTLELFALDMRQLELGLEAGSRWPRSTLGVPGEARLPRDTERLGRVVAVFNAGPEAAYDTYGAMADGRLVTPPRPRWPSVIVTRSQRTLLGPWTHGDEIPSEVLGFTQRRTALVNGGAAVPSPDPSIRRRTALCAHADGRLVYAYADALDASTLATSLARAGCDYAVPLAAGPERLGLALADVANPTLARFEPASPSMDFDAQATLDGSTRDFFYLLVRDVTPKLPEGVSWKPDGGTQPAPAWLPGVLGGELRLGGTTLTLTSFASGRFDFALRPGPLEPGAKGQAWSGLLKEEDAARALAALELGHATHATRYGLALGTVIPLPLRPTSATLVLGGGSVRILLPGEAVTLAAGEQAVQLPLLADDSDVTARARERGDARARAALGVTEDGRLVVATLRHDSSDPLAVALRAAGCRRVVELDRGSHHPAALERAGSDKLPRPAPESSTLWVLARK